MRYVCVYSFCAVNTVCHVLTAEDVVRTVHDVISCFSYVPKKGLLVWLSLVFPWNTADRRHGSYRFAWFRSTVWKV